MLVRARGFLSPLLSFLLITGTLQPVWAQGDPANSPSDPAQPPAAQPPAAQPPAAQPPAAQPPAAASEALSPASTDANWPTVTFQPDRPGARLERWEKGETASGWKVVCEGPCTLAMDRRHGYRINGDGVVSSPWFKLPKSQEALTLKSDSGSTTVRTTGTILSWAGPILGAVGLVILAPTNTKENEPNKRSPWDDRTYIGGGMMLGGVVMLLSGLALIGASSTTTNLSRTPPPVQAKKSIQIGLNGFQF